MALLSGRLFYSRTAKAIKMKTAEKRGRWTGDMVTSKGSRAKCPMLCASIIVLPVPARKPSEDDMKFLGLSFHLYKKGIIIT